MSTPLNWNGGKAYQMISMNSGICKTGNKSFSKPRAWELIARKWPNCFKASLTGEVKMKPQTMVPKILGLCNFLWESKPWIHNLSSVPASSIH